MKKIRGVHKILLQFKKSLFVLFNAMAEFVSCSFFLKNLHRHFCNLTYRKNFVKHIENLPQRLSEKCIGNTSLVIDIAKKLRFIDYRYRPGFFEVINYWYRPGFFEVIDYRYRFSTERFIVPITA